MKFEVYCDEAHPDVLTSTNPHVRYLMIGGVWIPAKDRQSLKQDIYIIREKHQVWGEIKWTKVSPSKQGFYLELIDLFFQQENVSFRCIAVDRDQVNMELNENDSELGFYKFYYQLLHHWIFSQNEYSIFCDMKSNRDPKRLPVLMQCLTRANPGSIINNIQSLPSKEVVLIQLCDLLLGAASGRLNATITPSSSKSKVVDRIETALGRQLAPTGKDERKFNIFRINLRRSG